MTQTSELEIILFRPGGGMLGSSVHAEQRITIGRDRGCDVVVNDPDVLPEHAFVHFTGRSCIIEPASQSAKVIANGNVIDSHLIQAQDTITLGSHTMRFVVHRGQGTATVDTAPRGAPLEQQQRNAQVAQKAPLQAVPQAVAVAQAVAHKPLPAAQPVAQKHPEPPDDDKTRPAIVIPASIVQAAMSMPKPAEGADEDRVPTKIVHVGRSQPEPKQDPVRSAPALALAQAPELHDDDDDDEDDDFVPFSLVEALEAAARPNANAQLMVEAVSAREGRVVRITHIKPGSTVRMPPPVSLQCNFEGGSFVVRAPGKLRGNARKRGQPISMQSLMRHGTEGDEIRVEPGIAIQLDLNDRDTLLFQHVERAELNSRPKPLFSKPSTEDLRLVGGSLAFHFVAMMVVGFMSSSKDQAAVENQGRYAEVQIKDLELVEPPPKPKPEPVPEPTPAPQEKPLPHQKQAKQQPQPKATPVAPSTPQPPQKSAAASSLLNALSGSLATPNSTSSALAAATNLDAVAAPKGAGFKVSGVIGKMPGNDLRLGSAGAGVGRVDTKSATELTRGGALGRVQGNAPSGKVRGVVEGPPPRSVQVQGSLDRGEIQKVVNDHLHEVQGCYERQLVKDPSLSGKIVSEWVITPTGTVGTVKIKSSSVRNNEVANCIQAALKRWHFPQPKGGPVTVTYPFVFSTIGM